MDASRTGLRKEDFKQYLGLEINEWQWEWILNYFGRVVESEGANPATCRHNVMVGGLTPGLTVYLYCGSCGTDISENEKRIGKNYEFDPRYNVWVHTPRKSH